MDSLIRPAAVEIGRVLRRRRVNGGRVNVKKIAGWTGVAFMMWFIITQPGGAAGIMKDMGSMMNGAAEGMSTFVTSMF